MGVVEEHLLHHQEHEEVEDGGGKGGQLVATLVAPPVDQGVGDEVEEGTNDEGVEGYELQSLLVLLPVHLWCWRKQQERPWDGRKNSVLTSSMQ